MTKRYINSKGDSVEVSDAHLDCAIKIKIELQKSSPSQRCSWARHKKMMIAEGFDDSDKNESYRQMIKLEQSSRGLLPSAKKYAEMTSKATLESIKASIGEIEEAKLSARQEFLALNRLKRELHKDVTFIDIFKDAFSDIELSVPKFNPVATDKIEKKKMLVSIADLHYGAKVDIEGFYYDTEVAERLVMEYADKCIQLAYDENVDEIYVVNMGDAIESAYMRHSQAFGVEKVLSNQIAGASKIIIKFLLKLSEYAKVKYAGINGNHDRMSTKNDTIYSDGAVNIINSSIKTFVDVSGSNIEYVESDPYHHIVKTNGRNFLFVHGDITPIKKQGVLAELSELYETPFDAILAGHIHHFTMREVGMNKYVVTFGSFKGSDEYSLKTIGSKSSRSQGAIIIDEDGEFEIKKINI